MAAVSRRMYGIFTDHYIWRSHFKRHFPHLYEAVRKIESPDWRAEFIKAEAIEYEKLPLKLKKLFYLVKDGDAVGIQKIGKISIDDLVSCDSQDGQLVDWAARKHNAAVLNYFYQSIISFYQNDDGSIDPAKRDKYGYSALHWSVTCNQADLIPGMILQGCDVNARSNNGNTPLWLAAFYGLVDIIKALLANNADVNLARNDGSTPLFVAAQNSHLDVAKLLLAYGADVNLAKDDGTTPLFVAAQEGHLDVVKLLLAHGADVNLARDNGITPLFTAAQNGHLDVVKLLLAHGASVNLARNDGIAPLYIAAQKGHLEIVKVLLDVNDIDINAEFPANAALLTQIAAQYSTEHQQRMRQFLVTQANPYDIRLKAEDIARIFGYTEVLNLIEAKQRDIGSNGKMTFF
jgi:ankyrin repeat protein